MGTIDNQSNGMDKSFENFNYLPQKLLLEDHDMGLFNLGKKKADATPVDAPAADAGDLKVCEKGGKEFPMSEGNMVLEGSAFCCNTCCPKEGDKEHEVCEFC